MAERNGTKLCTYVQGGPGTQDVSLNPEGWPNAASAERGRQVPTDGNTVKMAFPASWSSRVQESAFHSVAGRSAIRFGRCVGRCLSDGGRGLVADAAHRPDDCVAHRRHGRQGERWARVPRSSRFKASAPSLSTEWIDAEQRAQALRAASDQHCETGYLFKELRALLEMEASSHRPSLATAATRHRVRRNPIMADLRHY